MSSCTCLSVPCSCGVTKENWFICSHLCTELSFLVILQILARAGLVGVYKKCSLVKMNHQYQNICQCKQAISFSGNSASRMLIERWSSVELYLVNTLSVSVLNLNWPKRLDPSIKLPFPCRAPLGQVTSPFSYICHLHFCQSILWFWIGRCS